MGVLWEDNRGPVGDQRSGGGPVGVPSPSSTEKSHRGAPLAGARPGKAALRRRPPALTSGLASGAPRHEGSGAKLGGQREPRRAAEGAPNSAREGPGGASGSARPRREGGKEEKEEEEEGGISPVAVHISAGCRGASSRHGASGRCSKTIWTKLRLRPDLEGKEALLGSSTQI